MADVLLGAVAVVVGGAVLSAVGAGAWGSAARASELVVTAFDSFDDLTNLMKGACDL